MRRFPSLLALIWVCLLATVSAVAADSITGVVTNRTTNKPAAGDDVVLIRLTQGMQESTRTKTDARGRFTLEVPDDSIHLVRVTHDKANYFRPAPPGTQSVDIDVFSADAKVEGVATEAEVMHVESEPGGKSLKVVASFFVKNTSTPPRTQFSDRPFEFYLPAGAVVEGALAVGPGGMPVQSAPVPLGDPGHYSLIFPLRPCISKAEAARDEHCGESRFQVSYKVAYTGSLLFSPKVASATDTLAVMVPKSMTFKPGPSAPYTAATDETAAQAYVARDVQPSQPLDFTVSGTGQLPRDLQSGAAGGGSTGAAGPAGGGADPATGQTEGTAGTDTRPGGGLGVPGDKDAERDPWTKYRWYIIGALGLAMAGGAGVLMSRPAGKVVVEGGAGAVPAEGAVAGTHAALTGGHGGGIVANPSGTAGASSPLLMALKEELFALETDKVQGRLDEAEYGTQKAALEVVLRRALSRTVGAKVASEGSAGVGA